MRKMTDRDERFEQIETMKNLIVVNRTLISFVAALEIDMRKLQLLFYLKKSKQKERTSSMSIYGCN